MTDISALEAYAGQLSEAAASSTASAEKQHEYINGGPSDDVLVESGLVPTLAKQAVMGQAKVTASLAEIASQMAGAMTYGTTALGLAGTLNDGYFSVPSAEDSEYLILYQNVGGVATERKRYPSVTAVAVVSSALSYKAGGSPRKNLFNPASPDVALGYFPVDTTGLLQASASYNTTGFVPVIAGQQYTVSQKHYLCWYNVSKQFISGTSAADTAVTKTAPAGAAFLRCSVQVGANWAVFQVENGAAQTSYEAYKFDVTLNDGIVKKQHMADAAVAAAKTDFLKPGKNLFNKAVATMGSFVSPTTGTLSANASYDTSEFVAVIPGTAYKASHGIRFSCYFAANGSTVVAGGIDDNTMTTTAFTPPAGAAYVRISFGHVNLDAFQLELGTVATAYTPAGYKVLGPNGEALDPLPLAQAVVGTANLIDSAVAIGKTNFMKIGKNLFSKAAATVGFFINPSTGTMTASASFDTSALIPVTPGTAYKTSHGIRFSCYFASNGSTVVVGGINDSAMATTSFTPPAGSAYVRISLGHANLDLFQVEVGAVATAYEAYGYKVLGPNGETLIGLNVATVSTWAGKAWASLGDSITQQAKWQGAVVAALGLIWTNFGVGGTKVTGAPGDASAMCQDTRLDLIPTTADLVTVMGGTNDWAQNVPMGAPDSVDPLTFNGALNTLATKLMARFPAKRVALFATPYGEMYDYVPRGWPNAYTNTQGLTTRDYAEAVRQACKRWGLPCVDVGGNAGWNTSNIRTFITDDGALLHPNTDGGKRIAEVTIGGLRSLEPQA